MLSRRRRLRAEEVKDVLSRGRSVRLPTQASGNHLSMKFLQTKDSLRVAAVVPKSLARKATARNRLRRALYDSLSPAVLSSRTGLALFFVRTVPQQPLRTVFREEVAALLAKI